MPNPAIEILSPGMSRAKQLCLSLGLFFLFFSSSYLQAQLIDITWEVDTAFYEATEPHPTTPGVLLFEDLYGYVTYDVYANFTNETDKLIAIY